MGLSPITGSSGSIISVEQETNARVNVISIECFIAVLSGEVGVNQARALASQRKTLRPEGLLSRFLFESV